MSDTCYVRTYDPTWDELCQIVVDESTATKARAAGAEVSTRPFEGLPVRPRLRSEADQQRAAEAGHDSKENLG